MILLTGSTGSVGLKTAKCLARKGIHFRATVRDAIKASQTGLNNVEWVKGGTLYVPAGDGKAPFVDVRNIAAVAASCLTEPDHVGRIYEVTAPQAIGYSDIAEAFTQILGRKVSYVDVPVEAAAESMLNMGMPAWLLGALNELNTGLKEDRFSEVSDTVQRVGHMAPITLEQFIREYIEAF